MSSDDRQLMWHGMSLFLLGLVTGLLEQRFTNMHMGLSAHLEGLMNPPFWLLSAQSGVRSDWRSRRFALNRRGIT